jgi:hypothetical protein
MQTFRVILLQDPTRLALLRAACSDVEPLTSDIDYGCIGAVAGNILTCTVYV